MEKDLQKIEEVEKKGSMWATSEQVEGAENFPNEEGDFLEEGDAGDQQETPTDDVPEVDSKISNEEGGNASNPTVCMTEKGAIRLQLPGRIQHKTTIKLTHYPDGQCDNLVLNIPTPDVPIDSPININNQNALPASTQNLSGQYPPSQCGSVGMNATSSAMLQQQYAANMGQYAQQQQYPKQYPGQYGKQQFPVALQQYQAQQYAQQYAQYMQRVMSQQQQQAYPYCYQQYPACYNNNPYAQCYPYGYQQRRC